MSIHYHYVCESCGEDHQEASVAKCEWCGRIICGDCIHIITNYPISHFKSEDGHIKKEYCPFCRGDIVEDDELVEFLLNKLGLNRGDAVKMYREAKDAK
jgi:hypothetical protein